MGAIANTLRRDLRDPEYSEGYAESFLNSYVATQIKVLREQRGLSQPQLAALIGTTQPGISRIENVNYSSWNVGTLKKLARALNVRLRVSFEPYGTLPEEVESFSRESLQRPSREDDPGLLDAPVVNQLIAADKLANFKNSLLISQEIQGMNINVPEKIEHNIWPPSIWNPTLPPSISLQSLVGYVPEPNPSVRYNLVQSFAVNPLLNPLADGYIATTVTGTSERIAQHTTQNVTQVTSTGVTNALAA